MARGSSRKMKYKKTKSRGIGKKQSKGIETKKYRDIKHIEQRKLYEVKQKRKVHDDSTEQDYEEEHVDPVDQLLSTFYDEKNFITGKQKAVDSDSDECSDNDLPTSIEGNNAKMENDQDESLEVTMASDDEDLRVDCSEKEKNFNDPFKRHLTGNLDSSLLASLQNKQFSNHSLQWPELGDLKVTIPIYKVDATPLGVLDQQEFVHPGAPPAKIVKIDWEALSVKSQISKNIRNANHHQLSQLTTNDDLTPLQKELFSVMNNYQDLLYPRRTLANGEEVRFSYCLHAVNHVVKTRLNVTHHNDRLSLADKVDIPDEYRDQGLVRPKVLILAPFRESCYRIVNMMASILFGDGKSNQINKARFQDEFTGSELLMPKKNRKPEDFEQLFAGNVDDSFRIGLSVTKKSFKLFSDFYSSDIIIASPLGVRMLIGAEGEKDRDYDFLASIELLILDQTEVFFMQNWDHMVHLMNHLHMQPRESHGTDFSRVRLWALQGWAKYYRQTLVFSSVLNPEINSLFSRHCFNYQGAVRVMTFSNTGSISQVVVPLPHVYRRFASSSVLEATEERFRTLTEDVLSQFIDMSGVLIYVPSYFDFVRLRNYLKSKDFSFVQICEYSKDAKVARARDMFFHGEARALLYSERFHFYRRVNVKGIHHLIFYQPPTFPLFYSEMCNMMQDSNQSAAPQDGNRSVTVMYSKYDIHALAGIVRPARAARITTSEKSVFMFTTGQ